MNKATKNKTDVQLQKIGLLGNLYLLQIEDFLRTHDSCKILNIDIDELYSTQQLLQ